MYTVVFLFDLYICIIDVCNVCINVWYFVCGGTLGYLWYVQGYWLWLMILQNFQAVLMYPIKIHFIKYNCITTTSQTPITNITKNHEYNAYSAYMSIHSYVTQLSTNRWHMNKCPYVQAYISTFVYLGYLLNDNISDNEWMIMGILLHWWCSIDWLTLV